MVVCTHLAQDALLGPSHYCLTWMRSQVDSHLIQRLCKAWPNVSGKKRSSELQFTPLQSKLFNILNKYKVPCCIMQCVNTSSVCCLLGYSLYK